MGFTREVVLDSLYGLRMGNDTPIGPVKAPFGKSSRGSELAGTYLAKTVIGVIRIPRKITPPDPAAAGIIL